ncbi:recombination protein RecF [Clostridioides difficile]|nr:recombination protein RecF [Clostridioides difficile]
MKKYSIKKIKLQNFKLVKDEKDVDFENKKLIVLDGPNGYGKTTIFDAIEILIRGSRNIDNEYSTEYRDGDKPVFYANDVNKPVIIKGEFEDENGNNIILMRIINDPNRGGRVNDLKDRFEAYELEKFEDLGGKLISQEYINSIFKLEPTEQIYNLMYYIQQEDTLFFLKKSENIRREEINKLFNMDKESIAKEKLTTYRTKIREKKRSIENEISQIKEITKKPLENVQANIKYKKIITWKDVLWDKESIKIEDKKYQRIVSELNTLKNIIENIEDINNDKFNKNIDFCLQKSNEDVLRGGIVLLKYLENYNSIVKQFEDKKLINELNLILGKKDYTRIIKFIEDNIIFLLGLDLKIDINNMKELIKRRINFKNDSNEIDSLIMNINEVRNNLKNSFQNLIKKDVSQSEICPFCGYDYSNVDSNLFEEIDAKEKYFTYRLNEQSKKIELIEKEIQNIYINPLMIILEKISNSIELEADFISELQRLYKSKDRVLKLREFLISIDIDISKYWLDKSDYSLNEVEKKVQSIKKDLLEKRRDISNVDFIYNNKESINTVIASILDNNIENIKKINIDNIKNKQLYIQYLYFEAANQERIQLLKNLEILNKQYEILKSVDNDCDEVIKVYTEKIREYSDYMVKKLQIPLYIYSGKIIQNYQGGLGVFIKSEDIQQQIRLKFVNKNSSKHDVIKMFSSGQLSGLVISLILSVNRIFSKNNLNTILIDDPLQNMDDINMASFVELLRNEFRDKQIILSTHDERISRFIRYKYHKVGIDSKRYNVKEELN